MHNYNYLFPGIKPNQPLSNMAMLSMVKKKFKSLTTMAIGYSLDGGDLKSREIFKTLKK